jgi:glyoxylase-like metal-dependent hydrolase (beta-lactamase superfamily II)
MATTDGGGAADARGEALPPAGTAWVRVAVGTAAAPQLAHWSVWYPPGHALGGRWGAVNESYALRTPAGTVLIDPALPEPGAARRVHTLLAAMGGAPVAAVLTSSWHERDAYAFRETYGAPVWAPAAGQGELEGRPDALFGDGARFPGGLLAVAVGGLCGARIAPVCLLGQAGDGTRLLFSGDVLLGQHHASDPRGFPGGPRAAPGLYVPAGEVTDAAAFRASLRRLVDAGVDLVCPAHDRPYRDDPEAELARLLGA